MFTKPETPRFIPVCASSSMGFRVQGSGFGVQGSRSSEDFLRLFIGQSSTSFSIAASHDRKP